MLSRRSGGFSLLVLVVSLKGSLVNVAVSQELSDNVDEARRFLEYYNNRAAQTWPGIVQKMWNFNYNITEATRSEMVGHFWCYCKKKIRTICFYFISRCTHHQLHVGLVELIEDKKGLIGLKLIYYILWPWLFKRRALAV